MVKFSCFVDFSNLLGSLKKLNLKVDDYQQFFMHVFKESYSSFQKSVIHGSQPDALINRVYWYVVGNTDDYNFDDLTTKDFLRNLFSHNTETRTAFQSKIGKENPGLPANVVYEKAFEEFYDDRRNWYIDRKTKIKGFCDFYDKIRKTCDFIDISECGFWKLDFISKDVDEKGLDTSLAVDSVTMLDTYDVALIVSGDADMIPSIQYLRKHGKHVGVVSFIKGYPPEKKGRQQSRRLSKAADFDTQIFETDLAKMEFVHHLRNDEPDI